MGKGWEHFSHDADMGVRGFGVSMERAFEQTAYALTAVLTDPEHVHAEDMVEIHCEAPDPEFLLVDWLNALIYEMAVRKMIFGRFEVSIENNRLSAKAWGEPVSVDKHHPAVEVKGATMTELAVRDTPESEWMAQCVVDV